MDTTVQSESGKDPSKKEANKMTLLQPKADKKDATEKKSIELRVRPISLHSLVICNYLDLCALPHVWVMCLISCSFETCLTERISPTRD